MTKVIIVDFEDSFTYNIASVFHEINDKLEISVVAHQVFFRNFNIEEIKSNLIVLGPGPGHPRQYKTYAHTIRRMLDQNVRLLGICLGHQLILSSLGAKIRTSTSIKHGQTEEMRLNIFWKRFLQISETIVPVQRYNSLCVELTQEMIKKFDLNCLYFETGELAAAKHQNWITYQFHPESIGTKNPKNWLAVMLSKENI